MGEGRRIRSAKRPAIFLTGGFSGTLLWGKKSAMSSRKVEFSQKALLFDEVLDMMLFARLALFFSPYA